MSFQGTDSFNANVDNLSHQEATVALSALVTTLQSPGSDVDLKEEIDKLGDFTIELSTKFFDIFTNFQRSIASGISPDLQMKLERVKGQWRDNCEILAALIYQSGVVANDAGLTCREFLAGILPMLLLDSVGQGVKKMRIETFLEEQEAYITKAANLSQGFSDLQRNVGNFIKDVETILDGYDVTGAEKRIADLDKGIKDLLTELDGIRQQVAELSSKLDMAIAASSASSIFGFICPIWWVTTAITAAQIPSLKEQLSAAKDEEERKANVISDKEKDRARLQADIQTISLLRTTLQESGPDLKTIQSKLGAIAAVWAAMRADSQALVEKLQHAVDTDSKELFKLRVKTAEQMYLKLQTAVEAYRDLVQKKSSVLNAVASLRSTSASMIPEV